MLSSRDTGSGDSGVASVVDVGCDVGCMLVDVGSLSGPLLLYIIDGCFIRDGCGCIVILWGINVSNYYKDVGRGEFDYIGVDGYARIVVVGFNVVRFVMEWYGVELEEGIYDGDYIVLVV